MHTFSIINYSYGIPTDVKNIIQCFNRFHPNLFLLFTIFGVPIRCDAVRPCTAHTPFSYIIVAAAAHWNQFAELGPVIIMCDFKGNGNIEFERRSCNIHRHTFKWSHRTYAICMDIFGSETINCMIFCKIHSNEIKHSKDVIEASCAFMHLNWLQLHCLILGPVFASDNTWLKWITECTCLILLRKGKGMRN